MAVRIWSSKRWNAPRKIIIFAMLLLSGLGIVFLSLPTKVTIGPDGGSLAITRAEAVSMAAAALIQSRGRSESNENWKAAGSPDSRYELLMPFLAFAPATLADYMPAGYTLRLPSNLDQLSKVRLADRDNEPIVY